MTTAVIYTRVSSREQAEGFSIDAQIKACTRKATEQNLSIKNIFRDEGFSGTNMKRPALQEMLEYCKKHKINYVIIHKLDRLARSIQNHASIRTVLKSFNTDLISCTEKFGDKPHEMLLENIMASLAQYYTDNLKTEIHKGIRERFEQGYHLGYPPFGYKPSKQLKTMQVHTKNAQIVQKIYELYSTGKFSFKSLSDYIYKKYDIKTNSGKKFSKSKIQRILKDPVYIGKIKYKKTGEIRDGKHKAIIPVAQFEKVQEIMKSRGNVKNQTKGQYSYLFKGFVACPLCGRKLSAAYSTGKSGKRYLYYFCRDKSHKDYNIPAKEIEKAFRKQFEKLRLTETTLEIIDRFIVEKLEKAEKLQKRKFEQRQRKIDSLLEKKEELYKEYRTGITDKYTYQRVNSKLTESIEKLEVKLKEKNLNFTEIKEGLNKLVEFGTNFTNYWDTSPFERKTQILSATFLNTPQYADGKLLNTEICPLYQSIRSKNLRAVLSGGSFFH
ncbi:hypothetical protein GF357_04380 [Candidatus Dojkabacteria bacterium]|nr:hypothetical protein [Candidatus Dojkabacteria bacterium]